MEAGPRYTNVHIYAEAAPSSNVEAFGMYNNNAGNVYLTDVEIDVVGGVKSYGIKNVKTHPWLKNVDISAEARGTGSDAYGLYNEDSSPWVRQSEIYTYAEDESYAFYSVDDDGQHDSLHLFWSEIIAAGPIESDKIAGVYGGSLQTSYLFSTLISGPNNTGGAGGFYCTNCADEYLKTLGPSCADLP
jgi:hypothetical protein